MTQEKALQALHDENERLGLYKDAYASPKDAALKLALEALQDAARHLHPAPKQNSAITAIKEALAQPEQEEDLYDLAVKADNGGQP